MSLTVTVSQFQGGVTAYRNPTSRGVADYLYWMCGKFQLEGQFIISGTGGGTVLPVNPSGTPAPLDFKVTTTSFIPAGETTVLIPNFIGFNLLFVRNNIPQSTVNLGSSYFNWNKNVGVFTCYPAAVLDEVFQLYPFA